MKKSDTIIVYLIVYFLLLFQAGFVFTEMYSRFTNIFLLALTFFYVVNRKKKISAKCIFFASATMILEFITFVFRGFPEANLFISSIVDVLTAVLIVTAIDWCTFKKVLANINVAICVTSLVFFLLYFINIPLHQYFPVITNSYGVGGHFAILDFPRNDWASYRIQGIYWEPGAFQFFIVLSSIFDMFNEELAFKNRLRRFFIYIITLALTFSTTGIFCGLLLVFLFLYKYSKNRVASLSFFGFIIFAILSYGLIAEGSYLYYSLFGKMEDVNDSYINGGSGNATADTRVFSLLFTLEEFFKSPIVGIGLEGHEAMAQKGLEGGGSTITPLLLFANFGILLGLLHSIGLIKAMRLKQKIFIEAFFVLLITTLSTVSEQFAFNPILMSISMYGYLISPKKNTDTTLMKENPLEWHEWTHC